MNILSIISTIIYTSFFIGAIRVGTAERKNVLNISSTAVLLSLFWWSFCNSFFYAAATAGQAMFWHKLASIGWCGFVVCTAYYFFALTSRNKKVMTWWQHILFFAPGVILVGKNLFGKTTSLAQNIIQSTNGLGWTYQNSITSIWLWIFLIYVVIYFGMAYFLLYKWSKTVKHKMKKEMALWFIALDTVTILFGVVTDVIMPLTTPILPALASVVTAFFGIGYFTIIYRFDLFNINLVISSDDILQTSNNSIFVIDENKEILRYNRAASQLLGVNKNELIGTNFESLTIENNACINFGNNENLINFETKLLCNHGADKDVLLSASIANDKSNNFLCYIISCQDISNLKKIQNELATERENYKKLAADYQTLAYYDPLTGLPNRRFFFDTLSEYEKKFHEKNCDFAVIFLDLDNFKHVNDAYGHNCGDELLIATANKLQLCIASSEFLARLGGDEFMIIMPYKDEQCVDIKMAKIKEEFQQIIIFDGNTYEIKITAGFGIYSQIGDTTKLMEKADKDMYGNKKKVFSEIFENEGNKS